MGSNHSYPGLTEDVLEELSYFTYLSKDEIMYIMKKFHSIDPQKHTENANYRFTKHDIVRKFPVLKYNPFQDRLFRVFSSEQDDCFSFEDFLDLCSAMSSACPTEVKAAWAFKVFDINEDNVITESDITEVIQRLTQDDHKPIKNTDMNDLDTKTIYNFILEEMHLSRTSGIGVNEFQLIVSKLPEFSTSFYFTI